MGSMDNLNLNTSSNTASSTTNNSIINGSFHYKKEALLSVKSKNDVSNDSEYLNLLYKEVGENFLSLLAGNFSFSFIDETNETVFIVRDKFGTKPMYYYEDNRLLIFSTELRHLKFFTEANFTLNKKRMLQYLCQYKENTTETFFNEVKCIEPGGYLSLKREGITKKSYSYSLFENKKYNSLDSASNKLRDLLNEAINQRLDVHKNKKIGCMVSGGLDSSSIYSLLKDKSGTNLYPITMNFLKKSSEFEKCDETNYQDVLLANDQHRISIKFQDESPYEKVKENLVLSGQPFNLANAYIWQKSMNNAKKNGISVLFNGIDGDLVVSHGWERFRELFKLKTLHLFFRELFLFSNKHSYKGFTNKPLYLKFLLPLLRNNFFLKPLFKLKDAFRKTKPIRHILKKEVLDQIPIKERYDPYRMFRPHQNKIQNTMVDVLFSNIEIFSTDSEIFHESPFFDIKVVEFCQSLESKFKLNNGESRLVLREAMRDILPNEIVNRFSKANLTYNFMNSISPEDFRNIKNEIFDLHPILENVINKNNLLHELEILKRGTMSEKVSMNIWCFYQCNIWLKENKIRCN